MTFIEPLIDCFSAIPAATEISKMRIAIANNEMTPSRGLIAEATKYVHENQKSLDVWVNANQETSIFNDSEIKIMEDDLFQCQELGVDGVLIGATTRNNQIDQEAMQILIGASDGMEMFFSPSFDVINEIDWDKSIKWLIDNHFAGIITYKNFEKLQNKLAKEPTLRVIPITFNQDELVEIEDKYQPLNIINKK